MEPGYNQITIRQNEAHFIKLLRARSETYRQASRWQIAQFILTVIVPLGGAVLGIVYVSARPYVAGISLAIAMLDSSLIERTQKRKLKIAARICEQFDCELLDMQWNPFAAGKKVEPELIASASTSWSKGEDKLIDWYPSVIRKLPVHLARVVCQRTNLWYDGTLREKYSDCLLWGGIIAFLLMLITGLTAQLSLIDFVAIILTPATPIMIWTMRELFRQRDATDALKLARSEAEALWAATLDGACDEIECARRSREFQNTIFARRSSTPLIFPKLYDWLRPKMEDQMNQGAETLVDELNASRSPNSGNLGV